MTSMHEHLSSLRGADVYDRDGDKIGSIGQLYADAYGQPAWASVHTGLFGLRESLVPIDQAQWSGDRLQVPYEKKMVKGAPNVEAGPDEPLQDDDVTRLYEHYNLNWGNGDSQRDAEQQRYAGPQSNAGEQNYESGGTDRNAMTRSEEQLRVGTEREQVGQARLRKYVVTDNVQTTIPVQREEQIEADLPHQDRNRRIG